MHLKRLVLRPEKFPATEQYPFTLPVFHCTKAIDFISPVTFFVGENGTGKSTLLEALARKCGIHIWEGIERTRFRYNRYERELHKCIDIE